MGCKVIRDEDGNLVGVACGSSWGIGSYYYVDPDTGEREPGYGFPWDGMNPHDFTPDRESCTAKEIAAWEEARAAWDAAGKESA